MVEKNANKMRPKKRKEMAANKNEGEGEDKGYLPCNLQMEQSLADVLKEERKLGHKGDGGWKAVAYTTVAAILSAQFNLDITADNIRNRVKTWKKFYSTASDILSQSGFSWDATKKMTTVDEENVWQDYVKVIITQLIFIFCMIDFFFCYFNLKDYLTLTMCLIVSWRC